MDEVWHDIGAEAEFPADGKLAVTIGGWPVLIARADDGLFALGDRCSHAGSALSPGRLRRGAIMCPLHGARFDVATAKCLGAPYPDLRRHALRIADGRIEVAIPANPPGMADLPIPL